MISSQSDRSNPFKDKEHHAGRIVRSTGILTLTTGLSRILGFVRDLLIAGFFGTGAQAQAFVVAFRLPNLLRDLVAEGAVTSAFVPVLSWYRAKGRIEDYWCLGQVVFTWFLILLCVIGTLGTIFAPGIVRLIAPGFIEDPEKFSLTVRLTRLLFPFIILVGLWAYFMALLNSLQHFATPALGPAIMNVIMIAACVWLVPRAHPAIIGLAIGVIAGAILQLLIQVPVAWKHGFRFRLRFRHPGSSEVIRLAGPRTLGSAVHQGNILVHTALASLSGVVGDGAVAALYFANRLVQLPLALFGSASAQASLPSLAEQAAANDLGGFRNTVLSVIRMVSFLVLPASVGLMVLAFPIVGGLFERGAFDHHSTIITSQAVICYSLGLVAYSVGKVLSGAFYALKDTRTPVKLAIEAVVVNIILSLILMWPLKIMGLALSAALSSTLNSVRLLRKMEQRLNQPMIKVLVAPIARMLCASVLMGFGCWAVWKTFNLASYPILGLAVVIVLGIIFYWIGCGIMQVKEIQTARRWFGKLPIVQHFSGE